MKVDPASVRRGARVFAHHVDPHNHVDVGQFVGVVEGVIACGDVHYLHVRGGLEEANELYIPLAAVRAVVGQEVHLNLSAEELAAQAWHEPPGAARGAPPAG